MYKCIGGRKNEGKNQETTKLVEKALLAKTFLAFAFLSPFYFSQFETPPPANTIACLWTKKEH